MKIQMICARCNNEICLEISDESEDYLRTAMQILIDAIPTQEGQEKLDVLIETLRKKGFKW